MTFTEYQHHLASIEAATAALAKSLRLARRAGLRINLRGVFQGQTIPLPAESKIVARVGMRKGCAK